MILLAQPKIPKELCAWSDCLTPCNFILFSNFKKGKTALVFWYVDSLLMPDAFACAQWCSLNIYILKHIDVSKNLNLEETLEILLRKFFWYYKMGDLSLREAQWLAKVPQLVRSRIETGTWFSFSINKVPQDTTDNLCWKLCS